MRVLEYVRPSGIEEAINLMSADEYLPIAGGTDLIPQIRHGLKARLLDIGNLNLCYIQNIGEFIEIGAGTSHAEICRSDLVKNYLPLLAEACNQIGSMQIRNRGTVGGNIGNASPCADSVPPLLIYEAEIKLLSRKGVRQVKIDDFITAPYKIDRRPDELIVSIICRKDTNNGGHSFLKVGRRQAVNISRMSLAATITTSEGKIKSAKIAAGSVFPTPSRMFELERMLEGNKISQEIFRQAGEFAAELMIQETGYRWSTPYKKPVLAGLTERALNLAAGL